jgi:hypothetical protein
VSGAAAVALTLRCRELRGATGSGGGALAAQRPSISGQGLDVMMRVATVVLAVLALCLVGSSGAWATTGHGFADQFGAAGGGDGQFGGGGPAGVVVDQASGDVLVGDPGHTLGDGVTPDPRIERFDASGTFVSSFSIDAAAAGSGTQLAVDPAGAGSVYVSTGAGSVLKYSLTGTFAYALNVGVSGTSINPGAPVAVDPSTGTVYVAATDSNSGGQVIDAFDGATGAFVSSFAGLDSPEASLYCPTGLAADSGGVYVSDACTGRLDRYTSAGVFDRIVDDLSRGAALSVTADPVSGEVFVGEAGSAGVVVAQFTAGGASRGQTFGPPNIGNLTGIAINGTSGTVYTADNANTVVQRFTTFTGPTVTTTAASPVDTVSATLNGTIDPGGVSSTYHFEYGQDINYGTQTTESDPMSGTGAVAATGPVTGLLPNTTYHFRIVGTNAAGSITGSDQTFTTDPAPPTLDGAPAYASVIKTTGVTLNGTLNPNSSATSYHFEYGTDTTYGTSTASADAGAGAEDQPVTADLTGLTAGTTYHFRLVADNGTGGVQHGADGVFSTAPGTPPSASDVSVFGATLHGVINPHGAAATYRFEYGTSTDYGRATAETDGGSANAELAVSQATGRLTPNTTYHVRVVATINGQSTASDDVTFTTGAMPEAVATDPTGVTTTQATIGGTVNTYGRDGSYRFIVDAVNGAYSITTDALPVPAGDGAHDVSSALSGLPAGESFRVVLSVTSNGGTTASDQVVFSTAPVQVAPPPPPISPQAAYGCGAPVLNAYNQHPKPGETITITGGDLGVGGTVALGDTSIPPTGWSASGFSIEIPDTATGTLPLTVNCGKASNTIAVAIYQAPDNRFTITKTVVKGTTATLTLKLPGVGKVKTSAAHTASKTTTITKAETRTIKVALTKTGKKTLNKAKGRRLKVTIRVSYTPAGGTVTAHTKTVRFKTASKR